ncbi:ATP-binding protein [Streptomyces sp. NPDC051940]|uniref:sensor histidine kinase n=1 Tax=Streptomyces sp. NPDC051940 TaxID=3155675 RepID=UPI0034251972
MAGDRRAWHLGVRLRTVLAAVLVVAAGLTAGAVALVVLLRAELTGDVEEAARGQAAGIAREIAAGRGGVPADAAVHDEQFVQILDEHGNVVEAGRNVAGLPALARLGPGESAQVDTPLDDERFLVVAAGARQPAGEQRTVLVGRALLGVNDTTALVERLLLFGLPLLLVLTAGVTWWSVGRALAPVEAIRREVDSISAAELHRRVPLPRARDEIARLAATMNRMLDRLMDARDSQRRFISDASHELRSPVASLRQHAEVSLAHPQRTPRTPLARVVLAESLRMQRLVDDLLLLARADERALGTVSEPLDLDDLVFEEAARLRERTGLRIDTSGVSAARVGGDAAALRRMLSNLGDNAARHARERVAFTLGEVDGEARLTVSDDGPGIPEADRERVFERFVRLDPARSRDGGGSGLGLAIVAEVVAAHGGRVEVADSAWGGARFEVTLPARG